MSNILSWQCSSCGAPMGGTGFAPLAVECASCAETEQVLIAADGAITNASAPDPTLDQLGNWVRALRAVAAAESVCLGGCRRCHGPLAVKPDSPVRLPCTHCGVHRDLPLGTVVSQPIHGLGGSMSANLGGEASFELDYAIERREAVSVSEHRCPRCGAPVPAGEGSDECGHCGGRLWMVDADGRRFTYVLSLSGTRGGARVDGGHSLHGAEQVIDELVTLARGAFTRAGKLRLVLAIVFGTMLLLGMGVLFVFMRTLRSTMQEFGP